jgi:hypothetical protein
MACKLVLSNTELLQNRHISIQQSSTIGFFRFCLAPIFLIDRTADAFCLRSCEIPGGKWN